MKKLVSTTILLVGVFIMTITASVAWLSSAFSTASASQVTGSAVTGYFARGNGSLETPYILNKPVHVYNLAWLQYMGKLNEEKDSENKLVSKYFKIEDTDSINMAGWILPPIGTISQPFIGNFDGNNATIENLTISNYIGDIEDNAIDKRPLTVNDLGNSASIVGLFGVIGDYDGSITLSTPAVNEVKNLKLDKLVVRSETQESLMGLLAGYVNGNVNEVYVGESQLQVGKDVGMLNSFDFGDVGQALSLYSLIGAYNKNYVNWEEVPDGGTGGDGTVDGSGFGGSIDMSILAQRLTYMIYANAYRGAGYPIKFMDGDKNFNYNNSDDSVGFYRNDDDVDSSFIPLSVDTEEMFIIDNTISETYPKHYFQGLAEKVNPTNIGYIVGDKLATGTSIDIRSVTNINNSTNNVTKNSYDLNELKIYAMYDGEEYEINNDDGSLKNDSSNFKFAKYVEVATSFASSLKETVKSIYFQSYSFGDSLVYGIGIGSSGNVLYTTSIMENAVVDDGYPSIDSEGEATTTHQSYTMVNGGINFSVKSNGKSKYITTIAGTYGGTGSTTYYPFRIYEVNRQSDKSIASTGALSPINSVWVNSTGDVQYNLSSETYNGDSTYEKKYDSSISFSTANAVYYMEIPVKDETSDYVLSGYGVSQQKNPYLLYLDVGSADVDDSGGIGPGISQTYSINGVKFANFEDSDYSNYSNIVYRIDAKDTSRSSVSTFSYNRTQDFYGENEHFGEATNTTSFEFSKYPSSNVIISVSELFENALNTV